MPGTHSEQERFMSIFTALIDSAVTDTLTIKVPLTQQDLNTYIIPHLQKNAITVLHFNGPLTADVAIAVLQSLQQYKSLTELSLSFPNGDTHVTQAIALFLIHNNTLRKLWLNNDLDKNSLREIYAALEQNKITSVEIALGYVDEISSLYVGTGHYPSQEALSAHREKATHAHPFYKLNQYLTRRDQMLIALPDMLASTVPHATSSISQMPCLPKPSSDDTFLAAFSTMSLSYADAKNTAEGALILRFLLDLQSASKISSYITDKEVHDKITHMQQAQLNESDIDAIQSMLDAFTYIEPYVERQEKYVGQFKNALQQKTGPKAAPH